MVLPKYNEELLKPSLVKEQYIDHPHGGIELGGILEKRKISSELSDALKELPIHKVQLVEDNKTRVMEDKDINDDNESVKSLNTKSNDKLQ